MSQTLQSWSDDVTPTAGHVRHSLCRRRWVQEAVRAPPPLQAQRQAWPRRHPPLTGVALLGLPMLWVTAAGSKSGTGAVDEGTLSLPLWL